MADAQRARQPPGLRKRLLEIRELAGPALDVQLTARQDRHTGAVVAAVLQAPQPADDDLLRLLRSDVAHDAAHGTQAIRARRPALEI